MWTLVGTFVAVLVFEDEVEEECALCMVLCNIFP